MNTMEIAIFSKTNSYEIKDAILHNVQHERYVNVI